ncbi:MAG: alpha-glucan family phosphorylase, partial [Nitrospirota bacterium]
SDLGVPLIGVGLLHQQGYFRQILSRDGRQLEAFPYNDPTMLPIIPVETSDGGWLRLKLELPGRSLLLKVWRARVGKVTLYLLDSNDPLNSPWDRSITAALYPTEKERRLLQEIVLGVGGWLVLEQLGVEVELCHLNEGHAAFVVLARAHHFMKQTGQPFSVALQAVRAGTIFTTHTPVSAGFDRFEPSLITSYLRTLTGRMAISSRDVLALGKKHPDDPDEPFNMAYLAIRGSGFINGVSRLHGQFSRRLFHELFPRWPEAEVPVGHVTNGVHMPTWDSQVADELWTGSCGKGRWLSTIEELCGPIERINLSDVSRLRIEGRHALVRYVRTRLVRQLREHGAPAAMVERAAHVLDPNVLTLGFARRFTAYKRPTLLLHDPERLAKILLSQEHPVQLIIAGKAHPDDHEGKQLVQALARFAARPELFDRVVFLEDYDLTLAQQLTAGIDVWLNTPRRPWEACGTSGMKVLVNGGLNCSELDGWWAEAYHPDLGWALGDGRDHAEPAWDGVEAEQLYTLLEQQIAPEFYRRDPDGLPRRWLERVRASMAQLTPQFSAGRMLIDYVERMYLPAARAYRARAANGGKLANELAEWHRRLAEDWHTVRFGDVLVTAGAGHHRFDVQVYFGDLEARMLAVELYANPERDEPPLRIPMERKESIAGAVNGHIYTAEAPATRPAHHFTPRIIPSHPQALVPLEETLILWQR